MRYTFLSSSYQIFVAFVVALATALITTSWNTGIIEARWRGDRAAAADDRVDVATLDKPWTPISIQTSQPAPLRIGNLYQAQHPNAPRPNASAKSNDLTSNLFYALMYYGHPPQEHEGDRLTHEYERESGGGRVVAAMPWQDVLIQHLAYLAALELHHELYPEIALFNQERANMHRIAKLAIAKAPSIDDIARDPAADVQPYWLARRIAELSGDREFNAFADRYAEGLTPKVHGLARLIAEGAPLSVNPNHFGLPAVAHDVAQRTNDLDLRRKASELMHFLVEHLYDRQHRTVYPNYGTDKGPGSDTRQAIDQFTAIDGLWRYARATGDTEAERLARDLSLGYSPNTQNPAPFMDPNQDLYRLYATQNALGTYPQVDQASVISARLNFMVLPVIQALNAASGFTEHEEDYALALEFFERKFYDEIYNGFYDSYTLNPSGVEYDPVPKGEEYFLQVDIPIYFNYLRLNDLYERKLHRQGGSAAPATPAAPAADEAEAAAEAAGSDTTAAAETDAEAAAETAAGEATDNE